MIPITLQTVPVDLLLHIGTFLEDTDESRLRDISGITLAAILNDYEMLEHYMKKYTPSEDQYIITNEVAISGNLRALKWVTSKKGYPMDEWTCYIAAECGYLQMLQWLRNKGCPWNASTCNAAVQNGNLDMVKWLHSAGCPWDEMTCDWATESGNLKMLQWLHSVGSPWDEMAFPWNGETCEDAARRGNLEMFKWLCSVGCTWDEDTIAAVLENGDLAFLQWLHSEGGLELDDSIFTCVASLGNLEILQWLYYEGCPWDDWTCEAAARCGNQEVKEWARKTLKKRKRSN